MSGFVPNGLLSSEANSVTKVLDQKRWSKAEARAAELLASIKPNNKSETRRNAVVSYIQRLLMNSIPCQVFTFGSVPLKTYLPDGDIDLTAFGDHQKLHDSFIPKILCILESQLKNEHAEFKVKEVQYIQAEVKIIKCLVENFVVDISFNMLSGLCSLCFFEEINCLIGQNHLLKRSIILIKAWCYYESRLLGSNHGLISTYALEILVLYIFHLYNNRFAGPFEVLLRFLDFFSKFDWDNYCISLRGPVPIGSLPKMIAEPPRKDCRDLLFTEWFLNVYQSCYDSMPHSQENQDQLFVSKHINIIDPLCANNNLGRSINKGNFFRIKSAIAFGAQRLVKLLDCSEENLIHQFDLFFKNTWTRHGNGYWIHARIYNLYLRNKNVEKSTCQESDVEQAQASHGSQDIYQKPDNHLKESKQTFGTSDGSAVSQTGSSRTNGMFSCDRVHASSMKSALTDKGKSPKYSSNAVHAMHRFASVSSSSNSAPIYNDAPTQQTESGQIHASSSMTDNSMRSCSRSEVLGNHNIKNNSENQQYFGQTFYDWRSEDVFKLKNASNEVGFGVNNEISHYVDEATGMHTENSRIPNFSGYLQAPMDVNSGYVSFPPPPPPPYVLAPRYEHVISFGAVPLSIPVLGSFLGHNMPFSQDVVQFPEVQWFPSKKRTLKLEEITEPVAHLDKERQMAANSGSSSGNSSCMNNLPKDYVVIGKQKCFPKEKDGDDPSSVRITDRNVVNPAASSTYTPVSHSTSGTNLSSSPPKTSQPDDVSGQSTMATDLRASKIAETSASYVPTLQLTSHGQGPVTACNSSVSDPQVFVGPGSSQRAADIQSLSPFSFGSFDTQFPFQYYNLPTETGITYMDAGSVSLYSTEQHKHSDTSLVYYICQDETSEHFVNRSSDTLNGDYGSYWLNLQYARFCQNAKSEKPSFYPPTIAPPTYLQAQHPWNWSPPSSVSVVGRSAPLFPEMPSTLAPRPHEGINQSITFWLPRFSGGTGTFIPGPQGYHQRFYERKRHNKNPNINDFNSRERLSNHGQFQRQVEKQGNSNSNSRERFSGHAQFNRQVEKPGNSNSNSRERFFGHARSNRYQLRKVAKIHQLERHIEHLQVKIIKCLVENFVVDISFNMLSGLCSLCFFEEINCLIGQNHLFKRSIILIKAWCYYESRILGSNHGLISTYALEILVLYIFHLYNNRFAGPFEVLLQFLDFFSKFDWDNYCISLRGPVPIGSLPKMIAEPPRKDCRDLPFTEWFLNVYQSCYDSMPRSQENQDQLFVSKHINITDPLCANNNLGRSISKGNFFRIKSAIAFGAQRLVKLLDCSEENLIHQFDLFFKNTWTRHGNGYWIHARIYNLYLRNKNVEKSTCQESDVEQAQASHGSQDIYQKPDNHLKESKQTFGTSDGSAVSQTGSSRTNGMFSCDRVHASSMKSALTDKGKSPKYSSNAVHAMHRFASVSSSSNSAPIYNDAPTQQTESGQIHASSSMTDNSMRSCSRSEVLGNHNIKNNSENQQYFGQTFYDWRSEDVFKLKNASNEVGFGVNNEISHYVDEATGMHTENSRIPNFSGYLQAPMDVNSGYVSLPPPPPPPPYVLAPRYEHVISFGAVPLSIPVLGSFLGHNMPFSQDVVQFPEVQWFPSKKRTVKLEEITEPVAHLDKERQMAANSGSSSGNSSCMNNLPKDYVVIGKQKCFPKEKDGDDPSSVRITDRNVVNPAASSTYTPVSHLTSGTNLSSSPPKTSQPDDVSGQSTMATDLRASKIAETSASYVPALQLTSHGQGPVTASNSSVSDTQVFVGPGSSQRAADIQSLSPFAFGSFDTQFPFQYYNLPTETGITYMDAGSVSLYSTEQHKHSDTSLVYYISQDETSEHFVNRSSDTLNGDYGSYWLNLQYAQFCQNAKSEKPSFYPPTIAPPTYLQAQHPWNWSPPSSVSVVGRSAPLFPEMPSTLAPRPHEGINQSITFWLPRFSGGTGTFIPGPQGYHQRFYERKRHNKNPNINDFNSRERLSNHGQFQRQVEKPGNSNSNSRERFSGHAQFNRQVEKPGNSNSTSRERFFGHAQSNRQVEKPGDLKSNNSRERFSRSAQFNRRAAKPGTKEAPHQGEGSKSAVNKLGKFGKRF